MAWPIVTLTTDFGDGSAYVAQMKGALLAIADPVQILDLCHHIRPQDRRQARRFIERSVPWFPPGSIHVIVVDPGVGTDRPILAASIDDRLLVAPDNGILSGLWRTASQRQAVRLDRPAYWRSAVSRTFHGRDIMAPVAGHLARGVRLEALGTAAASVVDLPEPPPSVTAKEIRGEVVEVDAFGNLITNIHTSDLPDPKAPIQVQCGPERHIPVVAAYGDSEPGRLVALFGSSGHLEVAVNQGSAADRLGASEATSVVVKLPGGGGETS